MTIDMDLQEIGEVQELRDIRRINQMLKDGWILLAVIQEASFYHEGGDYSRPVYVLGKKRTDKSPASDT